MTSVFFLSYIFNILYNLIICCKSDLLSISFNHKSFLHNVLCEVGVRWNQSCRSFQFHCLHMVTQEIPKALSCFYVLLPGSSHTTFFLFLFFNKDLSFTFHIPSSYLVYLLLMCGCLCSEDMFSPFQGFISKCSHVIWNKWKSSLTGVIWWPDAPSVVFFLEDHWT